MVGAVLKGFKEADVTRHRPMSLNMGQYKMTDYCCLETDLVCPHARTMALKNNRLNWEWSWLTLEEASRYLWWTVHVGDTACTSLIHFFIDDVIWIVETQNWVNCVTKAKCKTSALFLDFASFHPLRIWWRHCCCVVIGTLRAHLLVFWYKLIGSYLHLSLLDHA